ncbi:polysaccharide pyruvyl transferase family protein [Herbiconiux sp. VKM Ac-1786]|uniref:polysaccharide pyruvyl transferase family protein n=1 Tax=Herbiconiux sp. VKM Ac-1786 TaxID=2783824 RepID=UPI00188B008B|nr:polysaccharide pyruvyl transferase family protein [Herbiconiux sp. VKM Ac-1786]MBF4572937.1 polysaccharide pyruvyl transferase family protein [Herbiconiux sp. VKM Ac-1786]
MAEVELVHWNPTRQVVSGRLGRYLPKRPVNNFGDLLGPVIVERILQKRGIDPQSAPADRRLLAIGSILHFAEEGDTVWGIGANGKRLDDEMPFTTLDVRAVRGPLTRDYLSRLGIAAPEVYGDPGLLVGHLWDRAELAKGRKASDYIVLPNFHDYRSAKHSSHLVNPKAPLWDVIGRIAASSFVVGSSLHAMIIAESLGIPARLVVSGTEPIFKFDDYYRGTGRPGAEPAETVAEALRMGGQQAPDWSPDPLLESFPADLWTSSGRLYQ